MSAGQQMPPWLQEQIGKLQQAQQNLQSIMAQKQQVEMDSTEADKALEELKKANDDDQVFKHAGSILIKSTKKQLIDELEETSVTGAIDGGAGPPKTPMAFSGGGKKDKKKKQNA